MPRSRVMMRAIDTNVVARYLLADDPDQHARSSDIIASGVFISSTVLLETGWLLLSRYRLARRNVASLLAAIVDLPSVSVADPHAVSWAIDRFAEGADLADMIHVTEAKPAGTFVTFDRSIADDAGRDTPVPIETLG